MSSTQAASIIAEYVAALASQSRWIVESLACPSEDKSMSSEASIDLLYAQDLLSEIRSMQKSAKDGR